MFCNVATASPEMMIFEGTYDSPKPPAMNDKRARTPAVLA